MHHVFKGWAWDTASWPRNCTFSGIFFGMKGKKLVPHHALETMAMDKQGAMLYGLTQGSEF